MKIIILLFTLSTFFSTILNAADSKPKYGSEVTLLSQSHGYVQKHAASDFWALIPYYIGQQDDRSCSVASVTMLINAARTGRKLTADDELATQKKVLEKAKDADWNQGVAEGGHGMSLDQLKPAIEKSLKAYGIEFAAIEVVHVDGMDAKTKKVVHESLVANEKSTKDFIVANFLQATFTGDADVGHIAPVGAYDEEGRRVLILDPDRQWYEPYWVSEEIFVKGMATADKESGKSRGFVHVKLNK